MPDAAPDVRCFLKVDRSPETALVVIMSQCHYPLLIDRVWWLESSQSLLKAAGIHQIFYS